MIHHHLIQAPSTFIISIISSIILHHHLLCCAVIVGISAIHESFPEVRIVTGEIDTALNQQVSDRIGCWVGWVL